MIPQSEVRKTSFSKRVPELLSRYAQFVAGRRFARQVFLWCKGLGWLWRTQRSRRRGRLVNPAPCRARVVQESSASRAPCDGFIPVEDREHARRRESAITCIEISGYPLFGETRTENVKEAISHGRTYPWIGPSTCFSNPIFCGVPALASGLWYSFRGRTSLDRAP